MEEFADFVAAVLFDWGGTDATLFNRLKHHTDDHLWNRWQYFSWFGLAKQAGAAIC